MDWQKQKVLVTGAAGFIGSYLTEKLLDRGATVKAFVHYNSRNDWGFIELLSPQYQKEVEIFAADIQDPYAVRKATAGCDIVFHLASLIAIPYSYMAPASYFETNVKGTLNVMESALKENVVKVVHTSTSETYGTAIYTPIDEKHPLQAQSPYSASKIGADKVAESYHLSFNLPVAILRPFNTFGPRQSARAVIPTIITQALVMDEIKLGSLFPVRDLTFVKDTVRGFIKIAECDKSIGETINIGSGKGVTIAELAQRVAGLLNKDIRVITEEERIRPEKSEVKKLICDNAKAKQLMDWNPEYSLEEGLIETVEFIKKNFARYKTEIYNI